MSPNSHSSTLPQAGEATCPLPATHATGESLAAPALGGQGVGTSLDDFTAWVRSEHLRQLVTVSAGCPPFQAEQFTLSVERMTRLHGALMLLQEFRA